MGGKHSKHGAPRTPLACMLQNFKKIFKGDYGGLKFHPTVLRHYCEVTWVSMKVSWPPQGTFNIDIINQLHSQVIEDVQQFAYIDCWRTAVVRNQKFIKKAMPKSPTKAGLFTAQVTNRKSFKVHFSKQSKSLVAEQSLHEIPDYPEEEELLRPPPPYFPRSRATNPSPPPGPAPTPPAAPSAPPPPAPPAAPVPPAPPAQPPASDPALPAAPPPVATASPPASTPAAVPAPPALPQPLSPASSSAPDPALPAAAEVPAQMTAPEPAPAAMSRGPMSASDLDLWLSDSSNDPDQPFFDLPPPIDPEPQQRTPASSAPQPRSQASSAPQQRTPASTVPQQRPQAPSVPQQRTQAASALKQRTQVSAPQQRTYGLRSRKSTSAADTIAPLREIVQVVPQEDNPNYTVRAFQFVPFSSHDLVSWKANNPSYSENPQKLTDLCESIMNSHNPTWADCKQLLMTLFSREEHTRIQDEAIKLVKKDLPNGVDETAHLAEKFPISDPFWDYNNPSEMLKLKEYQQLLIKAMRSGMKKPVNLLKIEQIKQGANESPDQFYERLLDTYQRYTPIEISDPANQRTITLSFVTHSAPDIRKKLQRQEGFAGQPISFLLELARKVYNNREETQRQEKDQKMRQKTQLLAAALTQANQSAAPANILAYQGAPAPPHAYAPAPTYQAPAWPPIAPQYPGPVSTTPPEPIQYVDTRQGPPKWQSNQQGPKPFFRGCQNCRSPDHAMAQCPHPLRCFNCSATDHRRAQCPHSRPMKAAPFSAGYQQRGHQQPPQQHRFQQQPQQRYQHQQPPPQQWNRPSQAPPHVPAPPQASSSPPQPPATYNQQPAPLPPYLQPAPAQQTAQPSSYPKGQVTNGVYYQNTPQDSVTQACSPDPYPTYDFIGVTEEAHWDIPE